MNDYTIAFSYGFLTCFGCVCFPVVLGMCLRVIRKARTPKLRTTATKVGKHPAVQVYDYEHEFGSYWPDLRRTLVGLGYTVNTSMENGRKVARFYMQDPKDN